MFRIIYIYLAVRSSQPLYLVTLKMKIGLLVTGSGLSVDMT